MQLLDKCCVVREGFWYDVGLILLFIRNVEGLADLSHQSITLSQRLYEVEIRLGQ